MHSETATATADWASMDGGAFRLAALAVPADEDYLALARQTTMHVAGMLGLTIARLSDLRLAVNEACALLLGPPASASAPVATSGSGPASAPAPASGSTAAVALELCFERRPGQLLVTVRGPAPVSRPDPGEMGWLMLQALVGEVRWETSGGTATVTLVEPVPVVLTSAVSS
jgi:serine/threonine-protein kinase RsbW